MNYSNSKIDYYTELKTTLHDKLKTLVNGLKVISGELQRLYSRKCPPSGTITLYRTIKKVTKPLYSLFNHKGNSDKALRQLKEAIVNLNLLVRQAVEEGTNKFKNQLQKLEQLAISLLPKNEGVQLALFDEEVFTANNRQPRAFKSFLEWLENLKYNYSRKFTAVKKNCKSIRVQQLSICLTAT
ncbi:MAG: hypothetical protein QNJ32_25420 [Xenococcaceae cyanobacterium MO_167.B27]|nr:hypothetical protein [Xenococcaceae cyanobacterium MO_167.B27]